MADIDVVQLLITQCIVSLDILLPLLKHVLVVNIANYTMYQTILLHLLHVYSSVNVASYSTNDGNILYRENNNGHKLNHMFHLYRRIIVIYEKIIN